MADSNKRVPTFGRAVDELDGIYPGTSMYDIVTGLTKWTTVPPKRWKDRYLEHLLFRGTGDGFTVTYQAGRCINGPGFRAMFGGDFDFCRVSCIRIVHNNGPLNYPQTVIEAAIAPGSRFGASAVRMFAVYGPDISYPIWGQHSEETCVGSAAYLQHEIELGYPKQKFNPIALLMPENGKLFFARMALELAVDWESRRLRNPLPDPADTASAFADIINRQWRASVD